MKKTAIILTVVMACSQALAESYRESCAKNMRMLYDLSVAAYLIVDARVTDGPKFFEMYYDQERYIPVQLRRGKKYLFLVAGEDRVTDLDLFIYDPRGTLAKSNRSFDADAGFWYIANQTGRYRLKVRMANCKRETATQVAYMKAEFTRFNEKRWWSSFPP